MVGPEDEIARLNCAEGEPEHNRINWPGKAPTRGVLFLTMALVVIDWSRGEGSPTEYFVPGCVGLGLGRRRKVWSLSVGHVGLSVCPWVGRGWVAGGAGGQKHPK